MVHGAYTRSDTVIERKTYARWQGRMIAGEPVVLEFGRSGLPTWLLPAMIAMMAVVLVGVTMRECAPVASRTATPSARLALHERRS